MTNSQNALDNSISQYQESPAFRALLVALLSQYDELKLAITDVQQLRSLPTATGAQLDSIGNLVGVSRNIVDGIFSLFFGFDPDASALSFGDLNDTTVGGRYRSAGEGTGSTRLLNDEEFRIYITGRIITNVSRCTGNAIIAATSFFFEILDNQVPEVDTQEGIRFFFVYVDRPLNPTEDALLNQLNLIPKSIGIRSAFIDYDVNAIPVYNNGTIYVFGDFIKATDTLNYVCLIDNTIGFEPSVSPAQWRLSIITA